MFTKTFSWGWLKSKKEEKEIVDEIMTRDEDALYDEDEDKWDKEILKEAKKVVRNTIYSNGIGTVIFKDGDVFSKEIEFDKMQFVKDCISKEEVYDLFTPVVIKEDTDDFEKEAQLNFSEYKQEVLDLLGEDFNEKNNNFFYKTISLPIDSLILNSLIEAKKENKEDVFQSLLLFFMKLCLNPINYSREDAMTFIKNNDIKISKSGNLILYRNVIKLDGDKTFIQFISNEYYKVKNWHKSPKNYEVWENTEDKTLKCYVLGYTETEHSPWKLKGNLFDLYVELPTLEENKYTSWHNKGRYVFSINSLYKIDEKIEKLNTVRYACHGGALHACNNQYDYSYFGDEKVIVIVNPSKIITIPSADTGKLTVSEMWIACTNPNKLGIHYNETGLVGIEDEYNNYQLQELEEAIGNKSFYLLQVENDKNEIYTTPITILDLTTIKNIISKRIINF